MGNLISIKSQCGTKERKQMPLKSGWTRDEHRDLDAKLASFIFAYGVENNRLLMPVRDRLLKILAS